MRSWSWRVAEKSHVSSAQAKCVSNMLKRWMRRPGGVANEWGQARLCFGRGSAHPAPSDAAEANDKVRVRSGRAWRGRLGSQMVLAAPTFAPHLGRLHSGFGPTLQTPQLHQSRPLRCAQSMPSDGHGELALVAGVSITNGPSDLVASRTTRTTTRTTKPTSPSTCDTCSPQGVFTRPSTCYACNPGKAEHGRDNQVTRELLFRTSSSLSC